MSVTPVEEIGHPDAVRALFEARSVALVGASGDESKFSGQPVRNLRSGGYPGGIFPVNRRGGTVSGVDAVSSIAELPDGVDAVMVMVPAASCPEAVREIGRRGIPVAVVAVSGFAEIGTETGERLQRELAQAGREAGVRIVGPNCNGIYETHRPLPLGYNYTHSLTLAKGTVGLVSHSGAVLGGFVPLLESYGSGISAFVSCGNEVDLELTDYFEYLVDDPNTEVIALIMDGVRDGTRFRRTVRRARDAGKPVVALKLGTTSSGATAAAAHSSRMAGAAAAYDAVFAADGVVSVSTLETLALVAAVLAAGRAPQVAGAVATSTSGAGGVMLADTLNRAGVPLATFAPATCRALAPAAGFAQVINPFDIGAAGPATIADNMCALAADPGAGAFVFYLTPVPTQAWREALAAGVAAAAAANPRLPFLVVSPAPISAGEQALYRDARVPVVASLDNAARALHALTRVFAPMKAEAAVEHPPASAGGAALSEPGSKRFLAERGVPVSQESLATTAEAAVVAAFEIGYPVVLKASGAALPHKSEHRLVALDVADAKAVRDAFTDLATRGRELDPRTFEGVTVTRMIGEGVDVMVGMHTDPDFGPMIVLGAGGVLTELVADVTLAPAPLTADQVQTMLDRTKIGRLLAGYRGSVAADLPALVDLVVKVSEIAASEPEVLAVDLNPVRVLPAGRGVAIVDALVIRHV
ncbi:acetate--CoA ligase family protein [Amycolatopsis alkalitolerans]|uniref:Acetate--CoA ligase family protein n=1 Tax=Amycolatopsis alkalitolerans TaxID=2547244 RepID=A0A5C4M7L3_9PSEU|nr:acetate--CoA ligase family protein [Amycolatopsis alkalitolerans]TNC29437.1 acetate--CoA ligase family protein [Amycolatopsis alkalitolerans]